VVNDRVKWEVVDVYRNPAKARELNVSFPGKAIVKSGEKREEVTLAQDNEETLTSAIYRVTKPDKSVVYYLTGHGELTLEEFGSGQYQCGRLRKALNNIQMDVKPLTLKRTGEAPPPLPLKVEDATEASKQAVQDVPDDAKVVMVLGPKAPLAQSEIDALNRYLDEKQGGLFLALSGEKGAPDLSQILSRYEVKVEPGFVIDAYKYLDSPAIPGIDTFDSGSEIVQNLSVVALPLTRAFSIQEMPPEQNPYGQPPPTPSATALLKTSGEAWLETSELKEGVRIRKDSGEVSGAQTVAVVIDTKKQKPPTPPGMPEMPEPDEGPGVRLVAVGSSMMLTDNFASQVPGSNLDFVAQSVSWLSGGQALSIPEKKPPTLTINFSSAQRAIVAWTLVGVIPLGTILIGVFVWWRRR
jgi:ABC-2 type transport system permease protein